LACDGDNILLLDVVGFAMTLAVDVYRRAQLICIVRSWAVVVYEEV